MKKILIGLGILVLLGVGIYYSVSVDESQTVAESMATFSSSEFGFEFDYKSGPSGYVIDERIPVDFSDYLRTYILFTAEDKANIDAGNIPVGGEGPATINVSIFKNSLKQQAGNWVDDNNQYSNIDLKMGEVEEAVVGGANAVRYTADGLYASDNVVVANGENIYVFSGMYIDAESDIKSDFSELIESVRFIPQFGQQLDAQE